MNYCNTSLDYQFEFVSAMARHGVIPVSELFFRNFGEIIRFRVTGDKPGTKNGWAILFPEGRGVFGSWKLNQSINWNAGSYKNMNRDERKKQVRELMERKKKYEDAKITRQNAAALQCRNKWDKASVVIGSSHQYLIDKQVKAYGVRLLGDSLLVPIFDISGDLVNIQSINSSGIKMFHSGAAVNGNYMVIGELVGKIYIVEGYATAATIYDITNNCVVVAFNVGNLENVVKSIRGISNKFQLIIAADNDRLSLKNIGLSVAIEVSQKFNINYVYPRFEAWQVGSDFNDLTKYYSKRYIYEQLQGDLNEPAI